jgi:hypothetical protein
MPKEAAAVSSPDSLVYLKYTFRYRDQFDEPNDDWLDCIEATSDELLGAYTWAKDDAMTLAFGGRGKKRLNRVFDRCNWFCVPRLLLSLTKVGKEKKGCCFSNLCYGEGEKGQGLDTPTQAL